MSLQLIRRASHASMGAMLATLSLSLSACDKLIPNGQSETMALLHAGSEKACVAPDVQKTLRELILPKPLKIGTEAEKKANADAAAAFAISFDLTTLQSAEKGINKVVCNTVAKLRGAGDDDRTFRITFEVSPSAERPGSFIVTGDTDDANAFARDEIGNVAAHQLAALAQDQEAAVREQDHQRLLALVTPKWLIGSWIPTTSDASLCGDGHALVYMANRRFLGSQTTGQWSLAGDTLHVVGQGARGAMELAGTIIAADPISFTIEAKDGSSVSFRRCSRDEMSTIVSMNSTEGMEPVDDK